MYRKRSNEPIRTGDVIEYYSPIGVAGDKRWLRQARVEAVDPVNSYMPLVLDNAEGIPSTTSVKRGCVSRDIRDGLIHDVHVNGSACIVIIDDRSHYMLFHS